MKSLTTPKKEETDKKDDLSLDERIKLLKLPPQERATILAHNAEKMLSHYQNDTESQELGGGDFIDY